LQKCFANAGSYARLPALMADLVRHRVAVIATGFSGQEAYPPVAARPSPLGATCRHRHRGPKCCFAATPCWGRSPSGNQFAIREPANRPPNCRAAEDQNPPSARRYLAPLRRGLFLPKHIGNHLPRSRIGLDAEERESLPRKSNPDRPSPARQRAGLFNASRRTMPNAEPLGFGICLPDRKVSSHAHVSASLEMPSDGLILERLGGLKPNGERGNHV
jgi:hypothetical protein